MSSAYANAIDPRVIDYFFQGRPTLARFVSVSEAIHVTRMSSYALLTLLLWDMIITFSREVEVVWRAKWTVVKVLFLLNRYVTPSFMAAHIWVDTPLVFLINCRIVYSFSTIAEMFCISFVSLVIVMRLYALFEVSHRTLYMLLGLWLTTFMAAAALMVPNIWGHLDHIIYISSLNFCSISSLWSTMWTQWLPRVIEHGILFVFLVVNAMGTPRKSQTNVLAVLYRQGIVYSGLTFVLFFGVLLFWTYGASLYIPLTAYSIGLILTLVTSRFFLAIEVAPSADQRTRTPFEHAAKRRDSTPYDHENYGNWDRGEGNLPSFLPPLSPTGTMRTYEPSEMARTISIKDEIDLASMTTREAHMVSVHWTFIRRRAWWLVKDR